MNKFVLDYGLLSDDKLFVATGQGMMKYLDELNTLLSKGNELRVRKIQLEQSDRIELDMFLMFAYNSMYWTHLRLQGVNVSEHPMKHEMMRIRETMLSFKQEKDKKLRPHVDVDVTRRVITHSLWNPDETAPKNKRKKFDDNAEEQ